ncbi:MAG: hypothetical protein J0G29_05200 [Alphaproteobacteria bacterium]|nr:hypothetical protein [Alphaproteobacteria bacterium]OJV45152.1 MAG: hypothetical protein BGO28_03980 [Alphaproteobacteria bacterium 43-37]
MENLLNPLRVAISSVLMGLMSLSAAVAHEALPLDVPAPSMPYNVTALTSCNTRELAELSAVVYEEDSHEALKQKMAENPFLKDYEVIQTEARVENGYFGMAVRKKNANNAYSYVMVHRGTDDLWGSDVDDNLRLLEGIIPPDQLADAEHLWAQVKPQVTSADSVVQTGHSLGGALAQLLNARVSSESASNRYTVVFDSPGVRGILEGFSRAGAASAGAVAEAARRTTIYNTHPNAFNTIGVHIAVPYVIQHAKNIAVPLGYVSYVVDYSQRNQHPIAHIKEALYVEGPANPNITALRTHWPSGFEAGGALC